MARLLLFIAVVLLLGLGFAWLADRPGDMVVTFNGYQYQVTLMAAAAGLVAIVAAIMLLWWLIKVIWNSPTIITRHFRARRRDRGYQALSTGMIAAGAGDAAKARQMNKQAMKLINSDQEPLIHLLEAQSLMLEGDRAGARRKYEEMIDDPEMRLLGLRGLFLEAQHAGDKEAARHYAARAADVAPQLAWASDSTLEEKAEEGDWDGALKLLDARKATLDKEGFNRRRGVLLTAKAMSTFETDQTGARAAALEANRLLPTFPPAAVVAARALFRTDEIRKGAKLLEAAWKADPNPEVADLYVHARPGDSTHDRLDRAKKLQSLRQNNVESSMIVGRAAFDAHEYKLARAEAEAAVRMQPREGAFLLLADIEEATSGDEGRVRQWLAKAVRAPGDPAWVADNYISAIWAPVSPVSGKLDAFEWKTPIENPGATIEQEELLKLEDPKPRPNAADPIAIAHDDVEDAETIDLEPSKSASEVTDAQAEETSGEAPARMPDDPGVDPNKVEPPRRFKLF